MAKSNRLGHGPLKSGTPFPALAAVHRAVHAVQEAVLDSHAGVTHVEALVLTHLAACGTATMGELHRVFGFRKSTVTNVVDRLVARGLVVRSQDPADGRRWLVRPTAGGSRRAKQMLKLFEAIERHLESAGLHR